MLAFVNLEERVPADHPLRAIKVLADEALARLSPECDRMYADVGRPSIPPDRLLKGVVADCVVLGEERASLLRGVGLQPAVPLVLGHATDGAQLRSYGVHDEPAATAGAPSGQQLFDEVALAADRRSDHIRILDWIRSRSRPFQESRLCPPPHGPEGNTHRFHRGKASEGSSERRTPRPGAQNGVI